MSVRNLIGLTTITPTVAQIAMTTTSETQIISNAASSNTLVVVHDLYLCNTTASAVTVTVNVHDTAALGGTSYPIMSSVSVPANSTIVAIDHNSKQYLLENMSIGVTAGTGSSAIIANATYDVCA